MDDGNIGIFGSSGYGKSTTLLTTILGIGKTVSQKKLIFIFLIMEMARCLPFKHLPHTADYFTLDEELKRNKLMNLLKKKLQGESFRSKKRK